MEMRSFRVAFIIMLLCSPASLHEPDLSVGQGVICDTLEQVERFAALRSDGKDSEVALQVLNRDVVGASACAFALVKFTGGDEPVARLSINGRPASVLEIEVRAVNHGSAWSEVSGTVQYILVPEKGLIA
jgi:hypothetical protein